MSSAVDNDALSPVLLGDLAAVATLPGAGRVIMGTASNSQVELKLPLLEKPKTPKNYSHPEVLHRTFETLSNLHKLLPNHLMELLHSCKSEEDKKKCENSEFSGLERILERHQFPREINLTPKPSSMPLWRRRQNNNANQGWKTCRLWGKNTKDPPTSTIVVRWGPALSPAGLFRDVTG
ncbi:uncharacterized protein C6orf201 homolog [Bos indicus x Bos taurus]|uniref:uncharacterized protein C6orf201 homolog n=1 Tax=Bos indicus x Bos taurus TaxID=30522 RepID=UPI000F7D20F8|nr:uncharacterized protein C6orf201 homolog [Bos indicus x Bos taurus]